MKMRERVYLDPSLKVPFRHPWLFSALYLPAFGSTIAGSIIYRFSWFNILIPGLWCFGVSCFIIHALESDVSPQSDAGLRRAIRDAGHIVVDWDDLWWSDGLPPSLGKSVTVFHGSLGNADRIATELDWCPGSAIRRRFAAPLGMTVPARGFSTPIGGYFPRMPSLPTPLRLLPISDVTAVSSSGRIVRSNRSAVACWRPPR
jgi:hypothetical protein